VRHRHHMILISGPDGVRGVLSRTCEAHELMFEHSSVVLSEGRRKTGVGRNPYTVRSLSRCS
jgi:hypothetical protein